MDLRCRFRLFSMIILVSMGMILVGCGKKAPPIPPGRLPSIVPVELKATLEGNEVYLTWRHITNEAQGRYDVLRSLVNADKPACADCPIIFQKVGRVSVDAATQVVEYKERVSPGYIYSYKVRSIGGAGDKGPASNVVVIDLSQ